VIACGCDRKQVRAVERMLHQQEVARRRHGQRRHLIHEASVVSRDGGVMASSRGGNP
jgi:hypothetical protein